MSEYIDREMEGVRFGILKAREQINPGRLTAWQILFLEERSGWTVGDYGSDRAYSIYCHRELKRLGPTGRMGLSDEEWEKYVKSFR